MFTSKKYQSKTLNQDLPKQAKHPTILQMFMSTRTTFQAQKKTQIISKGNLINCHENCSTASEYGINHRDQSEEMLLQFQIKQINTNNEKRQFKMKRL